jgi:hypothetical protein
MLIGLFGFKFLSIALVVVVDIPWMSSNVPFPMAVFDGVFRFHT